MVCRGLWVGRGKIKSDLTQRREDAENGDIWLPPPPIAQRRFLKAVVSFLFGVDLLGGFASLREAPLISGGSHDAKHDGWVA